MLSSAAQMSAGVRAEMRVDHIGELLTGSGREGTKAREAGASGLDWTRPATPIHERRCTCPIHEGVAGALLGHPRALRFASHPKVRTPQSYADAIRIAKQREAEVRSVFDRYDADGSGSIEMQELLCVLEDLKLLSTLKSDSVDFAARMFRQYDTNDDGHLE